MSDRTQRLQELVEAALAEAEAEAVANARLTVQPRPLAYALKDAHKVLGIGMSSLQREIRAGRLKVKRLRGRVVITTEELERYLAAADDSDPPRRRR